jgi:hypothetical protein
MPCSSVQRYAILLCCATCCSRSQLDLVPPGADAPAPAQTQAPEPCDQDRDAYQSLACGGDDCNDLDPNVFPGAPDLNAVAGAFLIAPGIEETHMAAPGRTGTSLAVDRVGVVRMAYNALSGIHYAFQPAATWQIEVIDSLGKGMPALGLDELDQPHAAYCSQSGLRHATRLESGWTSELVDTECRGAPSLFVAPNGTLHLAYPASDGIRYASNRSGGWLTDRVDANGSDIANGSDYGRPIISIVATASGVAHLVYASLLGIQDVWRHTVGTPGAWQLETLATFKSYGAVALDREGVPAVLYSAGGVQYAYQQGDQWVSAVVNPSAWAWSCWLAFDAADRSHVAFLDSNYGLQYAVHDASGWPLVPALAAYSAQIGASFALDAAATAHVVTSVGRFDDTLELVYATNRRLQPDGIDQNCDGVDGVDGDRDGHGSLWTGGDDCDDQDPLVAAPPPGTGDAITRCRATP